nr:serine/threonine-protein kinase [Nonomuraea terrae]
MEPTGAAPLRPTDLREIGPYRLLGRLGEGGMGTVFLARAPSRRFVALKVVKAEFANQQGFAARFHAEVENARRVASFCTAQVLDNGNTGDGRPYMVTEYIAGTPLSEQITTYGALEPGALHGVALGVAAALAAIHVSGLVHRDLKPANVMLSLSGPRVIDFGIARALDRETGFTMSGELLGSPGWWAPEQVRGEAVTPAVDIFAWGCLVAYAGSGRHPFGRGDAITLATRVLNTPPDLGTLPAPLDELVRRATSMDVATRPTAQDLLIALVGGTPMRAADPPTLVANEMLSGWQPPQNVVEEPDITAAFTTPPPSDATGKAPILPPAGFGAAPSVSPGESRSLEERARREEEAAREELARWEVPRPDAPRREGGRARRLFRSGEKRQRAGKQQETEQPLQQGPAQTPLAESGTDHPEPPQTGAGPAGPVQAGGGRPGQARTGAEQAGPAQARAGRAGAVPAAGPSPSPGTIPTTGVPTTGPLPSPGPVPTAGSETRTTPRPAAFRQEAGQPRRGGQAGLGAGDARPGRTGAQGGSSRGTTSPGGASHVTDPGSSRLADAGASRRADRGASQVADAGASQLGASGSNAQAAVPVEEPETLRGTRTSGTRWLIAAAAAVLAIVVTGAVLIVTSGRDTAAPGGVSQVAAGSAPNDVGRRFALGTEFDDPIAIVPTAPQCGLREYEGRTAANGQLCVIRWSMINPGGERRVLVQPVVSLLDDRGAEHDAAPITLPPAILPGARVDGAFVIDLPMYRKPVKMTATMLENGTPIEVAL